ncbi:MAG: hemerythrin domain-containing protein [Chloroflexi bacterium]|nr:hemerythrin domain-containing protein [Chloroflexota bacterium]
MAIEVDTTERDLTHPIGILMSEHDAILQTLNDLRTLVGQIGRANGFDKFTQLQPIQVLAERLLSAEPHHQREEQVLFPRLERLGISGPTQVMRLEHEELRARKRRLAQLAAGAADVSFPQFAREVKEVGSYIADTLEQHIYKENNILYPIALKTFPADEWHTIMAEFNRIGYCCFTPQLPGVSQSAGAH